MDRLTSIATAERPLRASQLDKLIRCPLYGLTVLEPDERSSGPAADTGSIVHAAVAAFHSESRPGLRAAAAIAEIQRAAVQFPFGDTHEAGLYLTPYLADPRNITADVVAVELAVELTLPPHALDPTGQPVVIHGTIDQIRREQGRTLICDLKTGRRSGWEMIHDHAYQIAAYTLAARACGYPDAEPGYLIRAYRYRERTATGDSPEGVYWWLPFTADDCRILLDRVAIEVAHLRSGELNLGPGAHCTNCPLGGLATCIPAAREKFWGLPT
jgi:hypothetical protein